MAEIALDGSVFVSIEHLVRLELRSQGLSFLPRQSRRSVLAGRHGSRMRGRGLDFEEIRAYVPGDDTRNIDWKVTLRTGRAQVRAYTEERDRPMLLIIDQSMSMYFGTVRAMKSVIAAELAAVTAWAVFAAGDRVGAVVFDDEQIKDVRPHRSRNRVHAVLDAIAAANARLQADSPVTLNPQQLDRALERALALATHDHVVIVISDFAGADDRTQLLLRELAASNDVIAALVYDQSTLDLKPGAPIVVTGGELQIELDLGERSTIRSTLIGHFQGRQKSVAELLRRSGVPMMAFDTAGDVVDQLRRLLGHEVRGVYTVAEPLHVTAQSPLAMLQELPLPAPVSYTPQTIGWWIVAALLLFILAFGLWRWRQYRRANRYRIEALRELADIERALQQNPDAAQRLPGLVKRVALVSAPREAAAALSGESWLQWLDRTLPQAGFLNAPGQLLPALAYAAPHAIDPQAMLDLLTLLRRWIREHRVHS